MYFVIINDVRSCAVVAGYQKMGLGHFPPDISTRTSPPEKNAFNVVEIEAVMIKQYFSSRIWVDETIRC